MTQVSTLKAVTTALKGPEIGPLGQCPWSRPKPASASCSKSYIGRMLFVFHFSLHFSASTSTWEGTLTMLGQPIIGAPDQNLPPKKKSENSGEIAILQYLENLGGDMARPHIKNLTSPIFDIAPPQRISESWPKLSRPWEDFQTLPQWNR